MKFCSLNVGSSAYFGIYSQSFLDFIFDRPETIHELVTDTDLSKILKELKPHLKNMLYYLFLRDYSTAEYAESIGQTDPLSFRSLFASSLSHQYSTFSKSASVLALSSIRRIARARASRWSIFPSALHELVTDADLSKILKELKPHPKNMLYYLFLRDYSTQI